MNPNEIPLDDIPLATVALANGPAIYDVNLDDGIEAAFQETFVYRTYLKEESFSADCKEGVVTLSGTVSTESHKSLAGDTAVNLPGVRHVNNQLQTEAEVDAENADKWIHRKAKLALFFRRNVSAINTDVDVKDFVVTLRGEASDLAQKELTSEYVKDIDGVVSVINHMVVGNSPKRVLRTAEEKIDDASVTAQVRAAMSIHLSTRRIPVEVTTRDGKVTLTGIAKSAAEKSLISKTVSDIHGVDSVNNEMTVKTV